MSRRYDRRTTTFSPDGRLFQVEYAMEAIRKAGTCIGIVYNNGVILTGEKRIKSKLFIPEHTEKFARIDKHIVVAIAGITSDANLLTESSQLHAARHKYKYQEPVPMEMCVHDICDYAQYYTQFGGMRPFGVSMLWAGYDATAGFQLMHSDPSGNYAEWQANAIGNEDKRAKSILKEDYSADMSRDDAIDLCIKILSKTMDAPSLKSEQMEVCTLELVGSEVKYTQLPAAFLDKRIKTWVDEHKDDKDDD